jgi:hypothetical protein
VTPSRFAWCSRQSRRRTTTPALCDRCRSDDKKYKDTRKEQIKEYREANKEYTKEYDIYYRELNKDILKEKAKQYFENNKDKIYAKNKLNRITCDCGCTSRRDKISQHKKSSCHQKLMEEKNKLKRNLTDEELDVFFRTNYPGQMYPQGILITSYLK